MTKAESLHRTQVLLPAVQFQQLQKRARREGVSVAALIRSMIDASLAAATPARDIDRMRGIFSDPGFSGRDHDAELYD